ncbi:unnamed protein product [Bursaphelenchus xylophilus]|uniref:(pine wood nematode) hypothetical protein n=1 Tax=Bursaphelenchus xylophilus TaxID=6326 RepID=A0A1I7SFL8_BURXY|nr:unnamed protein product [Bursaphelenchus xylophilus]CAG9112930.1 unnamed protein product [Bursaphelenchus xylophilus]
MFWPFLVVIVLRTLTFIECWSNGHAVASAVFFFHCDPKLRLIEVCRLSVMAAYYIGNANIAIERHLATKLFDQYEYTELTWTLPLNLFIQLCAACVSFFLFYYVNINIAYPTFGVWLYGMVVVFVFVYCLRKNVRLYENFDNVTAYKLTTRYQLSENVRSLRTMLVGASVCTIMDTVGCAVLITANATVDDRTRRVYLICFNMIIPFYAFSFVALCMLSNHVYRRKIRRMTRAIIGVVCFIRKVEPLPSPKRPVRSLVGAKIEFAQSEEKDIYFSQLRSSWEDLEPNKLCSRR